MSIVHRARAGVTGLALLAGLGGCTAWRPADLRGAPAPARSAAAGAVRVTRRDGTTLAVWAPRAVGDTLVGRRAPDPRSARVAVALADVARLERRRVDWDRTAGAAIGALAGAFALALMAAAAAF